MCNPVCVACFERCIKATSPDSSPPTIRVRNTLICCNQAPVDIDVLDSANGKTEKSSYKTMDSAEISSNDKKHNRRRSIQNLLQFWRRRSSLKHPGKTIEDCQKKASPTSDSPLDDETNRDIFEPTAIIHCSPPPPPSPIFPPQNSYTLQRGKIRSRPGRIRRFSQ